MSDGGGPGVRATLIDGPRVTILDTADRSARTFELEAGRDLSGFTVQVTTD